MEFRNCCKLNAPVIIQFSNGGAFNAGKGFLTKMKSSNAGGIAGKNIHTCRSLWCNRNFTRTIVLKIITWIDGLLDASEEHFAATGKPLYSSYD
jgi:fructose-bisphosphate aldolase class II